MNQKNARAIADDAPALVTNNTARFDDILGYAGVSGCLLEKFHLYWQSEAAAVRQLINAFTHLNLGYLQMDAIPREVRERYWVAEQQILLYEQECERRKTSEEFH